MNIMNPLAGLFAGSSTFNSFANPSTNLNAGSGNVSNFMGSVTEDQKDYMDFQKNKAHETLEMSKMNETVGVLLQAASASKTATDKFQ